MSQGPDQHPAEDIEGLAKWFEIYFHLKPTTQRRAVQGADPNGFEQLVNGNQVPQQAAEPQQQPVQPVDEIDEMDALLQEALSERSTPYDESELLADDYSPLQDEAIGETAQGGPADADIGLDGPAKAKAAQTKIANLTAGPSTVALRADVIRLPLEKTIKEYEVNVREEMVKANSAEPGDHREKAEGFQRKIQKIRELQLKLTTEIEAKHFENADQTLKELTDEAGSMSVDIALRDFNKWPDLEAIDLNERTEMLDDLRRFADQCTDEEKHQRKAAMAKIYNTIPLDKEFMDLDDGRRRKVFDQLLADDKLQQARATWMSVPKEERRDLFQNVLKIHCNSLGITDEKEMPEVRFYSDGNCPVDLEKEKDQNGFISSDDGNMYINDTNPAKTFTKDFDTALGIVIHENTHNYQWKLIKKLDEDKIKDGDPEYKQALLFRQNFAENGYLSEGPGYKTQPVELHAHRAGDEASEIFKTNSAEAAKRLLEEMREWANVHGDSENKVNALIDSLEKTLQARDMRSIDLKIGASKPIFDQIVEEGKQVEASRQVPVTPEEKLKAEAQVLIGAMTQWATANTSNSRLAAAIDRWKNDLNAVVTKKDQTLAVLERNLPIYRAVVDRHLNAAAELMDEMDLWLTTHTGYEIGGFFDSLAKTKRAGDFESTIDSTRRRFEDFAEDK